MARDNILRLAVGGAALFTAASLARAVNLPVGSSTSISGTTSILSSELASTDVANQNLPFSFTNSATGGQIVGSLFDDVVRENATGTLDFYYQITLNTSSGQIQALRTRGFTGWTTDVDFRTDSTGTTDPDQAIRFSGVDAGALNFIFSKTPLTAGHVSQFMFIKTTATLFNTSGQTDISVDTGAGLQGFSAELATYAPVPEPASLSLLAIGAVATLGRRARRRTSRLV